MQGRGLHAPSTPFAIHKCMKSIIQYGWNKFWRKARYLDKTKKWLSAVRNVYLLWSLFTERPLSFSERTPVTCLLAGQLRSSCVPHIIWLSWASFIMNSYHVALFMIIRWYILAVFIKSCTTTNRKLTVNIDQLEITGCLNAFPWKCHYHRGLSALKKIL